MTATATHGKQRRAAAPTHQRRTAGRSSEAAAPSSKDICVRQDRDSRTPCAPRARGRRQWMTQSSLNVPPSDPLPTRPQGVAQGRAGRGGVNSRATPSHRKTKADSQRRMSTAQRRAGTCFMSIVTLVEYAHVRGHSVLEYSSTNKRQTKKPNVPKSTSQTAVRTAPLTLAIQPPPYSSTRCPGHRRYAE
jgi:hypothetical protein